VERGWERAVETVLGSYLEAVCVDGLDSVTDLLLELRWRAPGRGQHVGCAARAARSPPRCRQGVQGVRRTEFGCCRRCTPPKHWARRWRCAAELAAGSSVVTRDGIWLGSDWLRLSRDADPHTGVIEREETLREIRVQVSGLADEVKELEHALELTRERVRDLEDRRDRPFRRTSTACIANTSIGAPNSIPRRRAVSGRGAALVAARDRPCGRQAPNSSAPRRICARARPHGNRDRRAWRTLEPKRDRSRGAARPHARELGCSARRGAGGAAAGAGIGAAGRIAALLACLAWSPPLLRIEAQLEALETRRNELAKQLAEGEAPLAAAQSSARTGIARALQRSRPSCRRPESSAKNWMRSLRERDAGRAGLEQRVEASRASLDEARLAAQQVRVRRESVAEQLAATNFELAALLAQLAPEATVGGLGDRSSRRPRARSSAWGRSISRPSASSRSNPSARNIWTGSART
jgi:chromosome segregation protein